MVQFSLLASLVATLSTQLRSVRSRDRGSISVEQVLVTAGLVTVTVAAIAAISVGVAKYAARI